MQLKKIIIISSICCASVGSGLVLTLAVDWKKDPEVVNPIAKTITYNGTEQELITIGTANGGTLEYALGNETESITEYSENIPTGIHAGVYYVWYRVVGDENKFHDVAPQNIEVTINKAKVDEPTITNSLFIYDGNEKEVEINGVESYMSKSNDSTTKATSIGEYVISYTLDNNHEWNSGSDGILNWSITKSNASITVDTTPIVVTYGDAVIIPTATSNLGTVTCDKVASDLVDAGTYTITYTVSETDDYTGDTKTVSVTINKKEVTVPTLLGTYTYNGAEQTATINNFDSSTMEYANDSVNSATNAGSYIVKINLKDTTNYKWDSSFNGEIEWKINKATPVYTAPVAAENLVYNGYFQFVCKTEGTVNDSSSYHWEYKYELSGSGNQYSSDVTRALVAGTYTIYYKLVVTSDNYIDPNVESSFEVVVAKVTPTVTAPTPYNIEYPGQGNHRDLCSYASTTFGTIVYQLSGCQEEYTPPRAYNKGYYTVYYWVVGDDNINDVPKQSIECSIY